jgi:ABC-type sugar transport system permease subunit
LKTWFSIVHALPLLQSANPSIYMMKLPVGIAIVLQSIQAFKVFDLVFVLTRGGPGYATMPIAVFTYNIGLKFSYPGYGSALSWLITILMMMMATVYVWLTGRR